MTVTQAAVNEALTEAFDPLNDGAGWDNQPGDNATRESGDMLRTVFSKKTGPVVAAVLQYPDIPSGDYADDPTNSWN